MRTLMRKYLSGVVYWLAELSTELRAINANPECTVDLVEYITKLETLHTEIENVIKEE